MAARDAVLRRAGLAALLLGLAPAVVAAQQPPRVVGAEVQFQGYTFDEGLGAEAAQLLMFPVAYRTPIGDRLLFDFYTAWAQGKVEQEGTEFTLSGPVDTQAKLSWRAAPWAVLSVAANIPTGEASKTGEEAVVAAVLSSDLLGFREASWGTGLGVTTGVAMATRVSQWGVGLGASYRLANEFEPVADSTLAYEPGDEVRVRLGLDRNVGETGKLNLGATFQNYSEDRLDGRNLFQAGNRLMFDGSYAFRAGGETWTLFAADVWRERGDRFIDLVDDSGIVVDRSTEATGSQNLIIAGISGAIPMGGQRLRPGVDLRRVTRDEPDGTDQGSGWVFGVGADLPLRLGDGIDLTPRARYARGSAVADDGESRDFNGAEFGLTLRWNF